MIRSEAEEFLISKYKFTFKIKCVGGNNGYITDNNGKYIVEAINFVEALKLIMPVLEQLIKVYPKDPELKIAYFVVHHES